MLPALLLLVLALGAVICAALALRYAWIFYGGVRKRHMPQFGTASLFGRSDTILALNDADAYASWRLARMNLAGASLCLGTAAALYVGMR